MLNWKIMFILASSNKHYKNFTLMYLCARISQYLGILHGPMASWNGYRIEIEIHSDIYVILFCFFVVFM